LLAAQSLVLLYSLFSNEEVYSFAWRIPFLLSALLIPFSFLTPNVPEKKESQESKTSEEPYLKALITYKKEVLYAIMIMSLCAVGFYTLLAFLPYYLVHINALSPKEAATCSSCVSFFCITFTLLGGYLSDLFNNKKFFLRAGAIGVTSVTCFIFLCGASSFPQWLIIQILYGISIGLFYSTRNSFFSAVFPKRVRCAAVALSINIAQAIFGGLIPVVLNYATRVSPYLSIMPALLAGISTLWALSVLKELKEGK
jgi:MFS family permease